MHYDDGRWINGSGDWRGDDGDEYSLQIPLSGMEEINLILKP
jgi:hypothetical protein